MTIIWGFEYFIGWCGPEVRADNHKHMSAISLMWKIHLMSIFLGFEFELLWSWSVQVGGSASVSQNMAGFLHRTWSLWTDQRRQRMLTQTTKASRCFLN